MIARTNYPCSICGDRLIDQHGALVCALCDSTEAEPRVFVSPTGVYTHEDAVDRVERQQRERDEDAFGRASTIITHCIRGCGSRLTVADGATTCRQCRLGNPGPLTKFEP